jgi:NADPH:quinone reductase-like Zn-dependent oxidoreductase
MTGRPYAMRLAFGLRRPKVAVRGLDLAGVVTAAGANVTRFHPGDEVYGTGQRVLVIGAAGGVGSFAVQLVKAYGGTVTGVCRTSKVDLVRSLGADEVIDHTKQEIDRDGAQYDTIIDIGGSRPLSVLRQALTSRGTLVLVGGGHQTGPILGGFARHMAAPLISMFVGQRVCGVNSTPLAEDLEELTQLIEAGKVTPAVGRTYPLAGVPDAIRDFEAGRTAGKLVVTM